MYIPCHLVCEFCGGSSLSFWLCGCKISERSDDDNDAHSRDIIELVDSISRDERDSP